MQSLNANEESVFGAFFEVTSLYVETKEQPLPLGEYFWRNDLTLSDILFADPFGDIGLELKYTYIILRFCIHLTMICHSHLRNL